MSATDMNANHDADHAANDLTQLSSREQLSALMDSALPADQARFLLRRLQHDAPLAGCWERWRIAGETMRGMAPARRLPADFASRVSAALHGGETVAPVVRNPRPSAWLRWGGGAAVAASLAVVALMTRQQAAPVDAPQPAHVAAASTREIPTRAPLPAQQTPAIEAGTRLATAATAAVALAVPQRKTQRDASRSAMQSTVRRAPAVVETVQAAAVEPAVQVPQPDIVTRPWPRSVLPQYASGGLTVGFGEHVRGSAAYNPFQEQAGIGEFAPASAAGHAEAAPDALPAASGSQPNR